MPYNYALRRMFHLHPSDPSRPLSFCSDGDRVDESAPPYIWQILWSWSTQVLVVSFSSVCWIYDWSPGLIDACASQLYPIPQG